MNQILKNCLYNDNISSYELILSLFNKCNLNCDFCFQSRINDIDIEAIKNIPNLLEENYPEELKYVNNLIIGILGGELFSDDIPDSMFDIYRNLCNDIIILIKSYNQNIKINFDFLSNGVYTKHDRILKLINNINHYDNLKQSFGLSYDPIGRFKTKEQLEMFKNTFWYFYNNGIIPEISTVLTKKNMNIIINSKDEFFYNISNDIVIYFNYYLNNLNNWKKDQPSDDDLFNFFKWAIDNNKFQFDIISNIIKTVYYNEKHLKPCSLNKSLTYYNKKFIKDRYPDRFPIRGNLNSVDNQSEMKCLHGLEKRGCLYCEYRDRCSTPCWCGIFSNFSLECFAKRIIQYLYDHPEVKDRYNEVMNK